MYWYVFPYHFSFLFPSEYVSGWHKRQHIYDVHEKCLIFKTTHTFFHLRSKFFRPIALGKDSLYYYISSKGLFSVAGYLKRSNENTSVPIDLHWPSRRCTLTPNTWQETRYTNVGFESDGLLFQMPEKYFRFRK